MLDADPPAAIPRSGGVVRPRRWLVVLLSALVVLAITARVWHSGLLAVDEPISDWARDNGVLAPVARLSVLGSARIGLLVAAVIAAVTWIRCRPLAVAYPVTVAVGVSVSRLLKTLVDRPRPADPETAVALAAFPSGHAIHATIAFGLLPFVVYALFGSRRLFRLTTVLLILGVAAVAVARVQLGAHWPTDVVGGILVGLVLVLAVDLALRHRQTARACRSCALHRKATSSHGPTAPASRGEPIAGDDVTERDGRPIGPAAGIQIDDELVRARRDADQR